MRFLEVVDGRPPNFAAIVAVFPRASDPGVIFAYSGRIYAPGFARLTPALHAHEQVHIDRQGTEPDRWWDKYLVDTTFRFEEELAAHRAEYQAYCQRHSGRKRRLALDMIATKLAAPLYGGMVTLEDARKAIDAP